MSDITDQPRIEVVSAIIIRDGKLLLQQRSATRDFPGKWETPGGKLNPGEPVNVGLQRELLEELEVAAFIGDFFNMVEFSAPVVASPLRIRFYRVDIGGQEPRCLDAMGLGWFDRAAVLALDMTPGTASFRSELAAMLPETSEAKTMAKATTNADLNFAVDAAESATPAGACMDSNTITIRGNTEVATFCRVVHCDRLKHNDDRHKIGQLFWWGSAPPPDWDGSDGAYAGVPL